jgi:hypothetical protein
MSHTSYARIENLTKVEPKRCGSQDIVDVGIAEALKTETARGAFYSRLEELTRKHLAQRT